MVVSQGRGIARTGLAVVVAVVGASLLGVLVVQPPAARADTSPPPGTPSTVSADQLPTWQVNGVVWAQVVVGSTVYVAGSFTSARPPGVAVGGAGQVAANNVFAYNITTGNRVSAFNHQLNGQAVSIAASPDGSRVYVGGDFTTVDGIARSHLAAFDTSTNALSTTFKSAVSARVAAFAVTNSTVYVGGDFTSGSGVPRSYLAAYNASNGALLPWAPAAGGGTVTAMTMSPDKSRVIAGGHFTTLNGVSAYGMGAIDALSGVTLPWAANLKIKDAGPNGAITSLRADSTQVYGSGYAFGSGTNFEGSFAANPNTGAINWVNDCHGDTYDVFPIGQVLYSVSHAHTCQWIGAFPESSPRVNHRALASTTYPTGKNTGPDVYGWNYSGLPDSTLLQWYPDLAIGTFTGQSQAAWSVSGNSNYVVLGGEFPQVNGVNQQGLVRFAVSSLAPNLKGPRTSTALTPVATSPGSGTAVVSWQSTWDQDNQYLTYKVYRDGSSTAAYSVTQASNFWQLPSLSFSDVGLTSGTHTYVVQVTDPFGNKKISGTSNAVTVGGGVTPSVFAQDAFSRTVATGWGAADLGGAWTTSGSSSFAVGSGVGTISMKTAGAGPAIFLNGVSSSTTDVQVTATTDKVATGSGIYLYVIGRHVAGVGDYRAKLHLLPSGAVALALVRADAAGVETTLQSEVTLAGVTYTPGLNLRVRLQTTGTNPTTVRAKAWIVSGAEPAAWSTSVTDSYPVMQVAGGAGLMAYLASSATNSPVVAKMDNFRAGPSN